MIILAGGVRIATIRGFPSLGGEPFFPELRAMKVETMKNGKPFEVLQAIRNTTSESGDLAASVSLHADGLLDCVVCKPLDCGVRRIRSATIQAPKPAGQVSTDRDGLWLLVVRAVDENGEDVVCFINGAYPAGTLLDYCYAAECGTLDWKLDSKKSGASSRTSFIDSLDNNGAKR